MDWPVQIVTGPPGGGKTYWVVMRLVQEILPMFPEVKVVTNVPIFYLDDPERVQIEEFARGWLPPGDTLEEQLEYCRNTVFILDECQEILDKSSDQRWREILGKARKRQTRWVFMSQSKDNIFKWLDDLAQEWIESINCGSLRDKTFGFRVEDLQELWAKLTGHWVESFQKTVYVRQQRRWRSVSVYREFFNSKIGECYDTKQGADVDEEGGAVVPHAYKRLSWVKLLYVVGVRNFQVIPMLALKVGLPCLMMFGGCSGLVYFGAGGWGKKPIVEPPVLTVADRALRSQGDRVVGVPAAATSAAKLPSAARKRVVVWGLLLCCVVVGCIAVEKKVEVPLPEHVARKAVAGELKTAVFGDGHALDDVLAGVGIESHTDAVVNGPLLGREVLDAARSHGYELVGDKLLPSRKRATPVPSELRAGVKGTVDVGGFPVKVIDDAERDHWGDLSSVVHEAYCTEVLIVSVTSTKSTQLSAIASGAGALSVSYPSNAQVPWWTGTSVQAGVSLAANGAVVNGRVVAHPVLMATPGANATVHVGEKIPVMLAQSTISNQTTTTLGNSLTYVQTGTSVTVMCLRVSNTQVRLRGNVTLSDQVSTINGVPVTDDRSMSVDHLVKLGGWQLLGRLDSSTSQTSGGVRWLSLGGLWSYSDDMFVVLGKTIQIHRDRGLHGGEDEFVEAEAVGGVREVVESKVKASGPEWKPDVKAVESSVSPPLQAPAPVGGVSGVGVSAGNTQPGIGPSTVIVPQVALPVGGGPLGNVGAGVGAGGVSALPVGGNGQPYP